nr:hypothetical protein XLIUZIGB_XLIUZIGB_CDS_0078 [Caudoviricetes sp.]
MITQLLDELWVFSSRDGKEATAITVSFYPNSLHVYKRSYMLGTIYTIICYFFRRYLIPTSQ